MLIRLNRKVHDLNFFSRKQFRNTWLNILNVLGKYKIFNEQQLWLALTEALPLLTNAAEKENDQIVSVHE